MVYVNMHLHILAIFSINAYKCIYKYISAYKCINIYKIPQKRIYRIFFQYSNLHTFQILIYSLTGIHLMRDCETGVEYRNKLEVSDV